MGSALSSRDIESMGGLGFMTVLIEWHAVDLMLNPVGGWRDRMDDLSDEMAKLVRGRVSVSLDREDELTDTTAFYVVRCEDRADAELVAETMGASIRPARVREPTPPVPDWLRKFSEDQK